MTTRHRQNNPLADVIRSQQEEIEKYKWIESEKRGFDIGWDRAEREWLQHHFPAWKRHSWFGAISEALGHTAGLN